MPPPFLPWPDPFPAGWTVLGSAPAVSSAVPKGLAPADILLFSPLYPGKVQNLIVQGQDLLTDPKLHRAHRCFTHVGLYIGNGLVCDATWDHNITVRSFADVASGMFVRAKRYPGLDDAKATEICKVATDLHGSYNLLGIATDQVVDFLKSRSPWSTVMSVLTRVPIPRHPREAFYCSSLVSHAFARANRNLGKPGYASLPATISSNIRLDEVQIAW